ncbi:MAG: carboxymuconolactone decarboxylase family protein [Blastocatellales bacterium]
MSRLTTVDPKQATGKAKELLDGVQAKIGMTPNLMKGLANSPAALKAYLDFSGSLAGGLLDPKLREQIALTVGTANGCEYCVSAHTAIGKGAGLNSDELAAARNASSGNAKSNAALKFARSVMETRGNVKDAELKELKTAGYSEGEIVEIVAHVGLNIFTNYFNHVAQTEIDFPKVSLAAGK